MRGTLQWQRWLEIERSWCLHRINHPLKSFEVGQELEELRFTPFQPRIHLSPDMHPRPATGYGRGGESAGSNGTGKSEMCRTYASKAASFPRHFRLRRGTDCGQRQTCLGSTSPCQGGYNRHNELSVGTYSISRPPLPQTTSTHVVPHPLHQPFPSSKPLAFNNRHWFQNQPPSASESSYIRQSLHSNSAMVPSAFCLRYFATSP